jgi:hypothetical protein
MIKKMCLYICLGFFLVHGLSQNIALAEAEDNGKTEQSCGDFLNELGKSPERLIFLDCQKTTEAQLDVLKATYKVSGEDAADIESYLQQSFQMPHLKFVCCGWEPGPGRGSYKPGAATNNSSGFEYQITMWSEETLIDDRSDWNKIPFFYVAVILPLEQP